MPKVSKSPTANALAKLGRIVSSNLYPQLAGWSIAYSDSTAQMGPNDQSLPVETLQLEQIQCDCRARPHNKALQTYAAIRPGRSLTRENFRDHRAPRCGQQRGAMIYRFGRRPEETQF